MIVYFLVMNSKRCNTMTLGKLVIKGVFTCRRASPLGRASPTKKAEFPPAFTWEKPVLLPGLARLAESPGLTTFFFRRNPESDI